MLQREKSINELDFLHEFPGLEVILPQMNFSPRHVIEYIKNMHEYKCKKDLQKRDMQVIHYKYKVASNTELFEFTDNMSLVDDIIIMCYLNHVSNLLSTRECLNVKTINDLKSMMETKYEIQPAKTLHYDAITWINIACAFPSISLSCGWLLCNHSKKKFSNSNLDFTFTTFPQTFNLKSRIVWYFLLSSIIPVLKFDFKSICFPITYFVAENHKIKQVLDTKDRNPMIYTYNSLQKTYQNTLKLCLSNAFPDCLKLKLCEQWGIIQKDMEQEQYKYMDYFKNINKIVVGTLTDNISNKEMRNFLKFLRKNKGVKRLGH